MNMINAQKWVRGKKIVVNQLDYCPKWIYDEPKVINQYSSSQNKSAVR
jgi:hypothetical protein